MTSPTYPKRRKGRLLAALLGLASMSACVPSGDYGDAPDGGPTAYAAPFAAIGQFPTREATGGPVARDVSIMTLGRTASAERGAEDPRDPDGRPNLAPVDTDSDDAPQEFTLELASLPPAAHTGFAISAPEDGGGGKFYLNVLLDLDRDGRWGGSAGENLPEWAVRNLAVTVAPGSTAFVRPPIFFYGGPEGLPEASWMRVALTREPVGGADWTGTGSFSAGEIEDHLVRLPRPAGRCTPVAVMQCPSQVGFAGGATASFSCALSNLRACGGPVRYSLTRHDGGVRLASANGGGHRDFLASGPAALGPAPDGPDNVVRLTFTARRQAPLPSRWGYRAWVEGNPAKATPGAFTIGYGDSTGEIEFIEGTPDLVAPH